MTESGQFVILNDASFLCVCPVIDNKFRHNIVKVVCGSHLHQNFLLIFAWCNLAVLGIFSPNYFQIGFHVVLLHIQILQFFSPRT